LPPTGKFRKFRLLSACRSVISRWAMSRYDLGPEPVMNPLPRMTPIRPRAPLKLPLWANREAVDMILDTPTTVLELKKIFRQVSIRDIMSRPCLGLVPIAIRLGCPDWVPPPKK